MPLHVYGVVRAGHPTPQQEGVGRARSPVHLVRADDLAAVVSELGDAAELTQEDAATHLDVLVALAEEGPVLPVPFGTVAPDDDAVRDEVLGAAAADLRLGLDALDGLVEARVDVVLDEEAQLQALLAEDAELAALRHAAAGSLEERIRVGEVVASRLAERRRTRLDALVGPLLAHAQEAVRLTAPDPAVDRVALLVRRDALPQLDAAVEEARRVAGPDVSWEYVGPLPAYSFLDRLPRAEPEQPASRWGW